MSEQTPCAARDLAGLCFSALGDVRKMTRINSLKLECEIINVCHCRVFSEKVLHDRFKKKKKKKKQRRPCVIHCERKPRPPRGHQSCQLLVFLRATKHTPVNVCECEFVCACVCVCVCVFISGGQFRVRLALSELQWEQFGQL